MEGLARAERALFTRPAPKSARAQMKFLRKREKGSTKSLADRLGVSRKTVQRYLSGASTKPNKRLQEALVQEAESEWQPQVRAQARQRATTSGGLVIKFRASLGFTANGSSDDARVRDLIALPRGPHPGGTGGGCDGHRPARGGRGGHRGRLFPSRRWRSRGPGGGIQGRSMAQH
ncbi:telomere-protecting terminal protein Tpg [Streptomyces sp. NPDC087532]